MKKKKQKSLFLAWMLSMVPVFLLMIATQSHSQILEKKPLFWLNPGIGTIIPVSPGDELLPSAYAGINFQYGHFMASTHFTYLTDWELKYGSVYNIALLIGLATCEKEDHCSFTTGIARFGTSEYNITAFVAEFQAFQKLDDNFGVGTAIYVTKNRYFLSAGVYLNIVVGLLR